MTIRELLSKGIVSLDSEIYIEIGEADIHGYDCIQSFGITDIYKVNEKDIAVISIPLNSYIGEFIM